MRGERAVRDTRRPAPSRRRIRRPRARPARPPEAPARTAAHARRIEAMEVSRSRGVVLRLMRENDEEQAARHEDPRGERRIRGAAHAHRGRPEVAVDQDPVRRGVDEVREDQRHHHGTDDVHRLQVAPEGDIQQQRRKTPRDDRQIRLRHRRGRPAQDPNARGHVDRQRRRDERSVVSIDSQSRRRAIGGIRRSAARRTRARRADRGRAAVPSQRRRREEEHARRDRRRQWQRRRAVPPSPCRQCPSSPTRARRAPPARRGSSIGRHSRRNIDVF